METADGDDASQPRDLSLGRRGRAALWSAAVSDARVRSWRWRERVASLRLPARSAHGVDTGRSMQTDVWIERERERQKRQQREQ